MERNMDLIRSLLLRLESYPIRTGGIVAFDHDDPELSIEGFTPAQIYYHLRQILNAGFIDNGGMNPMNGIGFRSLTWEGHDFLDSIRDPKIWENTKKGVSAAGGFTFDLLKDLAKGLIKKQIEERTGIKL